MYVKPRMSIRIKFFAVILFLLLSTLAVCSWFVYRSVYEDKKLFVMDLNLTLLHAVTSDLKLELKERLDELQLLLPRIFQDETRDPYQGLSKSLPDELLNVTFFRKNEKGFETIKEFLNTDLLSRKHLSSEAFAGISQARPLPLETFKGENLALLNRSVRIDSNGTKVDVSILTFLLAGTSLDQVGGGIVIAVTYLQDFLRQLLQRSELADVFLIFSDGTLLSHSIQSTTVQYATTPYQHPIQSYLKGHIFPRESFELKVDGEPNFVNVAETGFKDLYAVAQTKRSDALISMQMLSEKGSLIAILIITLSLIVSTFFASHITTGIKRLREATELIGTGHFNARVEVRSNDEIGVFAHKFQWMTNRLKEIMEQSIEAARDRKEGETNGVIRSTLRSVPQIETSAIELAHFFQGTAESGTNFWDACANDRWITVLMGDATSKGISAALTTAMARSCFNSLCAASTAPPISPDRFLTNLNRLFHTISRGQLTLSACMARLDIETGELLVATAGNLSPVLVSEYGEEVRAERVSSTGPMIGTGPEANYQTVHKKIEPRAILIFDTPGFTAAVNADAIKWGEDDVLQILSKTPATSASALKARLELGYREFTNEISPVEDATVVVLRWKQKASTMKSKTPASDKWPLRATTAESRSTSAPISQGSISHHSLDGPAESSLVTPTGTMKAPHVHDAPDLEPETARREAYIYEHKELPVVKTDVDAQKTNGNSGAAAA